MRRFNARLSSERIRLFDLHCDTLYECYTKGGGLRRNGYHIDLERGGRYAAWAQVFAVWMPDELRGEVAVRQCKAILEWTRCEAAANADRMEIVDTAAGLDRALAGGRCAALLAVEGGSALGGRLETLGELAALGIRMITVTWNGSNELGHGCASGCDGGLTAFGREAVAHMERLGIWPDVSHLNEAGFRDVLDCTAGPVLATHSAAAAVHSHARNLTDAQFTALRDRGGLVGLNLCKEHLGEQSFACFERHLAHYLSLDGGWTVAVGCDFDGTGLPESWGGIQVMEALYMYLQNKGYGQPQLERLFFGNSYDFMKRNLTNDTKIK